jgi:hypothetical protein
MTLWMLEEVYRWQNTILKLLFFMYHHYFEVVMCVSHLSSKKKD